MGSGNHIKVAIVCIVLLLAGLILFRGTGPKALKASVQDLVAAGTEPVSRVTDGIRKGMRGIFSFKKVTRENEALKTENQRLQQENINLDLTDRERRELKELSRIFQYDSLAHYDFQAANVSAMDSSAWQGIFTIDKGSCAGIKTGMAVISEKGVVGRVLEVSDTSAKIISILAEESKISFQIKGNRQLTGVIRGDGHKGLAGYVLDGKKHVKQGDVLETSGIGSYPEGLKIGVVSKVEEDRGTQKMVINAESGISFFRLQKVAVIL